MNAFSVAAKKAIDEISQVEIKDSIPPVKMIDLYAHDIYLIEREINRSARYDDAMKRYVAKYRALADIIDKIKMIMKTSTSDDRAYKDVKSVMEETYKAEMKCCEYLGYKKEEDGRIMYYFQSTEFDPGVETIEIGVFPDGSGSMSITPETNYYAVEEALSYLYQLRRGEVQR